MKKNTYSRLIDLASSIAEWLIVVFLYMIIRFVGNSANIPWANDLRDFLLIGILTGILLGIIFWLSELLINKTGLKKRSYYILILFQLGMILLAATIILGLLGIIITVRDQSDFMGFRDFMIQTLGRMGNISFVSALVISSVILSLLQQMKGIIGREVLVNLIFGKYHFPRKEKKVFMFIDMKSSTTIAEKIGHVAFSRLIQDCFIDLTDSVIRYNAQIYKYIGDEAIISWDYKFAGKGDPLNLYFHFNEILKGREDYYLANYGTVPVFKAGLNAGEVTTLEVGVVKKEIAHLSDVLNTAARIQGMCNTLDAGILISEEVKSLCPDNEGFEYNYKDELLLRGKEQKVKLYEVKKGN